MSDTFTCYLCGRTFPKERSDDEAMAEAAATYGDEAMSEPLAVVCDDCWQGRFPPLDT